MNIMGMVEEAYAIYQSQTRLCDIEVPAELIRNKVKYVIVMDESNLSKVFFTIDFMQKKHESARDALVKDLGKGEAFCIIGEDDPLEILLDVDGDLAVVVNKDKWPVGIVPYVKGIKKILADGEKNNCQMRHLLKEYQTIVECLEEEIFVSDQEGKVLLLNPQAERLCGVKASDVIGMHVSDLEREKVFSSSTTMEVIRTGKKVNLMQKLKSGKTVFATGIPIFDEYGELIRVLSTSKDVKEINHLISELENKDMELERKNQELISLREELFVQQQFVSSSKVMNVVKEMISKIAPTDLTVLIQGESGVGKEVVTKVIHRLSSRNKHPFIKINCGLIPENLLESELFGYEGGAFTGANRNGKIGKIELANHGTLFLDEIGEMPLSLQVKLLEFLQDREIIRVGGTTKIKVDTRVIAATNRDLQEMVKDGKFRQDLFYRLNVIPINIPSLRERIEDIPSLAKFFLNKFNVKYHMNKEFDPEVIVSFYSYNWPGNVRELEHVVERLVVTSDSEVITSQNLSEIVAIKTLNQGKVICTDLIPLRTAKRELEEQLVKKAYNIYKSTYKVGEVLQIDQSTVVKILKKYRQ